MLADWAVSSTAYFCLVPHLRASIANCFPSIGRSLWTKFWLDSLCLLLLCPLSRFWFDAKAIRFRHGSVRLLLRDRTTKRGGGGVKQFACCYARRSYFKIAESPLCRWHSRAPRLDASGSRNRPTLQCNELMDVSPILSWPSPLFVYFCCCFCYCRRFYFLWPDEV